LGHSDTDWLNVSVADMGITRCVSCFLFALLAVLSTAGHARVTPCCAPGPAYAAGEVLVSFEAGTTLVRIDEIAGEIGATRQRDLGSAEEPRWKMSVPEGSEESITLLEAFIEVRYATTNLLFCPGLPACSCCPVGAICPDFPLSCQIFDDSLELPEKR